MADDVGVAQERAEETLYSERLLDHFRNPRNAGVLTPPALVIDVENPACGDMLRLSVEFNDGVVTRAAFQVKGCTASIAAGSALTGWLAGKSADELRSHAPSAIRDAIEAELGGLPTASKHAAVLASDGVAALLRKLNSQR